MTKPVTERKRPPQTGTLVGVRLPPELLVPLDAEIAEQSDQPTRPEAIRRILAERYKGEDQ